MSRTDDTCGSCGREDKDLIEVRRVYLIADDAAQRGDPAVLPDELEWWCAGCRATYPHQVSR